MTYERELQDVYDAIIAKLKALKEAGLVYDVDLDDLLILYQAIELSAKHDANDTEQSIRSQRATPLEKPNT